MGGIPSSRLSLVPTESVFLMLKFGVEESQDKAGTGWPRKHQYDWGKFPWEGDRCKITLSSSVIKCFLSFPSKMQRKISQNKEKLW